MQIQFADAPAALAVRTLYVFARTRLPDSRFSFSFCFPNQGTYGVHTNQTECRSCVAGRFNALDGSVCRELKFNNDNGRFIDNRVTRCDSFDENVVAPPALPQGPSDRALAIREGFQKQ